MRRPRSGADSTRRFESAKKYLEFLRTHVAAPRIRADSPASTFIRRSRAQIGPMYKLRSAKVADFRSACLGAGHHPSWAHSRRACLRSPSSASFSRLSVQSSIGPTVACSLASLTKDQPSSNTTVPGLGLSMNTSNFHRMSLVALVVATLVACGNDGIDGIDGTDGTNGTNGLSALIHVSPEPPGANCASGGSRVDSGQDTNRNAVLDPSEVSGTQYICNGSGASLVGVTDEPRLHGITRGRQQLHNEPSTSAGIQC